MQVAAVVVTFNRVALLRALIDRLTQIERVGPIVVVDNASTDGTGDWLSHHAPPQVRPVVLDRNTGGAGGFHTGIERAVADTTADLIWLMDDDGLPDVECLDSLLEHSDRHDFWGPVVVDEADPERLVFPIRLPGGTRVVHAMSDVRGAAVDRGHGPVIEGVVIPFNGVLVTRDLVRRIGLPRAEFFIWGDDHEYRLRAERDGGRVATVVDAVVRHPSVGELGTPMMGGRTTYNHSPSDLKHYCMARNNLLNLREYRGWLHASAFVAKTVWFYAFTRPNVRRLRISASAMLAGLRGDFTGHRRYL